MFFSISNPGRPCPCLRARTHLTPPPSLPPPLSSQEKNTSTNALDGKVGRIYVPSQDLGGLALAKAKGVKRARREAAAEKAAAGGGEGGGGGGGGRGGEAGGEESE